MLSAKILRSVVYASTLLFYTCSIRTSQHTASHQNSEKQTTEAIFTHEPIPEDILKNMIGKSLPHNTQWPVRPNDLSHLTISHWGCDDMVHIGHMIVHSKVAAQVLEIFKELFEEQFPIERMELVDEYDANDDRSMEANNTSAFCCRSITDKPGIFSNHSYGLAIDINPRTNPYIKWSADKNKWLVYPESGKQFVDLPADGKSFPIRTESHQGVVTKNNVCCKAFKKRGWDWGGDWTQETHGKNYKDYQHFAKEPHEVGL